MARTPASEPEPTPLHKEPSEVLVVEWAKHECALRHGDGLGGNLHDREERARVRRVDQKYIEAELFVRIVTTPAVDPR